jgi:ankyrin repeat protein
MSKSLDYLSSKFENIPSGQGPDNAGFVAIYSRPAGHQKIESLQLAAYHGNLNLVATMLAEGNMVDELGPDGNDEIPQCTALQAAVYSGYEDIVHLLVASNANINAPSPKGGLGTALLAAVTTRNQQLGGFLLIRGADPNMVSGNSAPLVEVSYNFRVSLSGLELSHRI